MAKRFTKSPRKVKKLGLTPKPLWVGGFLVSGREIAIPRIHFRTPHHVTLFDNARSKTRGTTEKIYNIRRARTEGRSRGFKSRPR